MQCMRGSDGYYKVGMFESSLAKAFIVVSGECSELPCGVAALRAVRGCLWFECKVKQSLGGG